jgi:serine/threonine-protein kinase RsbW
LSPRLAYARNRARRSPHQRAPDRTAAWSYTAVPESLRRVRNDIAGFARQAGAPDRVVEAIRQASSEAAANAVEHAYQGEPGRIDIRAELEGAALQVVVSDRGRGLAFGNRRPSPGLGFIWMLWFSDNMTLDSSETGGLEVRMQFSLN